MSRAQDYWKFADECLRWAAKAETEKERDTFLQMARDWTLAAMRLEHVFVPRHLGEHRSPPH